MKPAEYWKKRSEQVARRQHNKADQYAGELRREYDRAMQSIQRDIEVFYNRFAVNNEISMAEARKLLTTEELKEFRMTLEEFTAKAKDNADGRWTQQLNNVYYRTRISRFEVLQIQARQQIEMLAVSRQKGAQELLGDVYKDTYYRTLFEVQKGTGIGVSFAKIDDRALQKVLGTEFAGSNWSKRIWGDRDKLTGELYTKLSQSFIRGDRYDRTTKELAKRMNVSYSNAQNLVQTEGAFFTELASMDGYKESGVVERYEVLVTLDELTCPICGPMDGKTFKLSEMEVSINHPPFHGRCRCTTVPSFKDEIDVGERIARSKDGKTYYVPGDMNYEGWYEQHVVGKYGQEQADVMKKMVSNESADREQFHRYKDVLGKDAPKSFAGFQDLKYNKASEWSLLKLDHSRRSQLLTKPELRLPNAELATAADSKFTGYLFNPDNPVGSAKGIAFAKRLGYNADNWKQLQDEIIKRSSLYPSTLKLTDQHGSRYEQKMILYGVTGNPTNVVVGWNVTKEETKMTTAYIKEVKSDGNN